MLVPLIGITDTLSDAGCVQRSDVDIIVKEIELFSIVEVTNVFSLVNSRIHRLDLDLLCVL